MRNDELVRQRTEYLNLRGLNLSATTFLYDIHILVSNEPKVVPTESCRYDIHICAD